MARPVLILFARAPRLGTVKTRLAAEIGEAAALRFYRNSLAATLRKLNGLRGYDKYLTVTPRQARAAHPAGWRGTRQSGGGPERRVQAEFCRWQRRQVILIGADIPALSAQHIRAAHRALQHADAVFGPAADGGYYLVAMGRRRTPDAFHNVRWSTEHALADTLQNFTRLRVRFIDTLQDVDTARDLALFQPRHQLNKVAGAMPRIELVLQNIVPAILHRPGAARQRE